jgi:hypothetical protein
MLEHAAVTGDLWVVRFDSQGLITRFREDEDGWHLDGGSMQLHPDPNLWDLKNWFDGGPVS